MAKKADLDGRRALELLQDPQATLAALAERLGTSQEAVDEARSLLEEIGAAEIDAILAMPPQLGRALLRAASQKGRHDVLVEAAASGDKEYQKEAKRLAHALKLRGIELELPTKQAQEPQQAPEPQAAAEPPIFLSNLDAFGERAIFWSRNLPGRGIELAQLVVSDERGVLDFLVADLSRKRFRELIDELPTKGGVTIQTYDRDEALAVIQRARVAAREGGECPTSFPAWAAQLFGPIPAEAPGPLSPRGEGKPPEDPPALARLAAASGELFDEPELGRWRPDDETLRSFGLHLEEAASSPLYLEGAAGERQREEALAGIAEREAAAYFDERRRSLYAGYLLDTARLFELTGRQERAQTAAAAALLLASGAPVSNLPFALRFFDRLFGGRASPTPAAPLLIQPE